LFEKAISRLGIKKAAKKKRKSSRAKAGSEPLPAAYPWKRNLGGGLGAALRGAAGVSSLRNRKIRYPRKKGAACTEVKERTLPSPAGGTNGRGEKKGGESPYQITATKAKEQGVEQFKALTFL